MPAWALPVTVVALLGGLALVALILGRVMQVLVREVAALTAGLVNPPTPPEPPAPAQRFDREMTSTEELTNTAQLPWEQWGQEPVPEPTSTPTDGGGPV